MVVTFKKMPALYSVDIEADEICQIKKEEDILHSENKKQSLTDFRKFHRKTSVLESLFLVKLLALNLLQEAPTQLFFWEICKVLKNLFL